MEAFGCLERIVDFYYKVLLLLRSNRLGDGALFSGLGGLAVEVVEQGGTVGQGEKDTALVEDFVSFSTVFFLFATRHGLWAVDNLELGGALGRDDKGWLALEVTFAGVVLCADCWVNSPFFIFSILNRDVLSDMFADH